ncbi:hypothetical protein [Seohaeicola zhoushanensis]|uniref:Uncharacterized protein n=1 Tax=Seohaeicola zhoushanensis TaxID=1569283 RepID=A0A8J3GT20_9RHOB|nr:hypothetical protein [Seohaeicola zhoushanensis]GHF33314.1 hypothetical protein GCM10017056_00910 [Seohaeicola zhoushanensis]
MSATRPRQNAFSSGEIDPLLHSREDFQRHQTGTRTMSGFIPLRQGGFTRAPGSIYRGTTKDNKKCRRVPFQFADNDALSLEFTGLVMRVWRYGELVLSGGSPYELATPFKQNDLNKLSWVQDKDVIYMTDGEGPVQKITRLALDNWTIADAAFDTGPFKVQNLDEALTIQASAATGTITLTATGGIFSADWVGSLIRLAPTDIDIPKWVGNQTASVGDKVIFDSRIYELTAGTNTGLEPPTHEAGTVLTTGTTKYKFISDLVGLVRVTAYTDSNHVTAEVLKTIPAPIVAAATYRWSEGAWSVRQGWPAALEMYIQRFWAAATESEPRTVWASTLGAFEDFTPGAEADESFAYTISATQTQNKIQWLARGRKGIYIGALGEVYLGKSDTPGSAISPTTFDTELVSPDGSTKERPIGGHGYPIHVARGGFIVQELRYSFEEDGVRPIELSLPSQHLGGRGFGRGVWQSKPQRYGWYILGDGSLAVVGYDPDQDVLGWAVIPVAGGVVEDIDVTPGLDGGTDIVNLVVRRTIDGVTVRYVEEQALIYGVLIGTEPIHKAIHVFAASVFEPGAPEDTFTVAHLVGQDVYAWTDKGQHGPFTVPVGGSIQLPVEVNHAVIGLFDDTHMVETLGLQAAAKDGATQGRQRRLLDKQGIDVYKTAAGRVAAVERMFGSEPRELGQHDLLRRQIAADLTTAWSGTARVDANSGFADEVSLRFYPVGAAPMTVTALTPNIDEGGP